MLERDVLWPSNFISLLFLKVAIHVMARTKRSDVMMQVRDTMVTVERWSVDIRFYHTSLESMMVHTTRKITQLSAQVRGHFLVGLLTLAAPHQ